MLRADIFHLPVSRARLLEAAATSRISEDEIFKMTTLFQREPIRLRMSLYLGLVLT